MTIHLDPRPDLMVERGPENKGVGPWVPLVKHRLLSDYLKASRYAWKGWPHRIFIDPFGGPGRIQVRGEENTRDGGAVVAWRELRMGGAPFTHMMVGDKEGARAAASADRLAALGANASAFPGSAVDTVREMVAKVPRKGSLTMAYLDPYNLEYLSFSIIEELAKLKVDLAINFCTMDLQRNVELEFGDRGRFDEAAPGWKTNEACCAASKATLPDAFFRYWCSLIEALGFSYSREMPLVHNNEGSPIYRMVFFARHDLPVRLWGDIARGPNRQLF